MAWTIHRGTSKLHTILSKIVQNNYLRESAGSTGTEKTVHCGEILI